MDHKTWNVADFHLCKISTQRIMTLQTEVGVIESCRSLRGKIETLTANLLFSQAQQRITLTKHRLIIEKRCSNATQSLTHRQLNALPLQHICQWHRTQSDAGENKPKHTQPLEYLWQVTYRKFISHVEPSSRQLRCTVSDSDWCSKKEHFCPFANTLLCNGNKRKKTNTGSILSMPLSICTE